MAGFFIPGIGQGGGANPNPNPDAFTRVNFNDQTNELILTTAGGVAIPVDLSNIKPTITQGVIKSVNIVNKELVIEDVDGQIVQIPLSRVLGGVDITLTPIQGVQSDNVQGAIEEVSGKTITAGAINGNNIVLTQENGNQINVDVTRLIGVNTINTESPDAQGNIDLALEINVDNLEFKVKDNVKNTLELYTDADANTLIQYFV